VDNRRRLPFPRLKLRRRLIMERTIMLTIMPTLIISLMPLILKIAFTINMLSLRKFDLSLWVKFLPHFQEPVKKKNKIPMNQEKGIRRKTSSVQW
jgi:hypothetical protein